VNYTRTITSLVLAVAQVLWLLFWPPPLFPPVVRWAWIALATCCIVIHATWLVVRETRS